MKVKDIRKELIDIYGVAEVIRAGEPVNQAKAVQSGAASAKPPVSARTASFSDSWDALEADIDGCMLCRLGQWRKNIVFGEGNRGAELMFVGEGPGAQEDRTGRPFVGDAGQLLTKMIVAMGYKREDVYIANVVKCRPPDNRNPFLDEAEICVKFLQRQIKLINPKIIVCLGGVAVKYFLGVQTGITKLRGNFQEYNGIKVMPTFHPAYLLRNPGGKRDVWNDLQLVMAELKDAK